jgi:HAD superfamily hydrolase (TIGR01490 family)
MPKVAAIFDLDDTILRGSSGRLFLHYARRRRRTLRFIRLRNAIPVIASYLQYFLGGVDAMRAMERSALAARGIAEAEVWALVDQWFDDVLMKAIAPAAIERVQWHHAQGHIPVICSASSQFAVQPVADYLQIEHTVHTIWLVEEGRLTGRLRHPIVYGLGKVHWMNLWAEEHDVSLADSYFYSDHNSDRPLLELVGAPIAVNPDRQLAQLAAERGWPILNWKE